MRVCLYVCDCIHVGMHYICLYICSQLTVCRCVSTWNMHVIFVNVHPWWLVCVYLHTFVHWYMFVCLRVYVCGPEKMK